MGLQSDPFGKRTEINLLEIELGELGLALYKTKE